MVVVASAMWPISTGGAELAMPGMLWCSATQNRRYPSRSACRARSMVARRACAAVPPSGTGARSRTDRGTARGPKVRAVSSTTCANRAQVRILPPPGAGGRRGGTRPARSGSLIAKEYLQTVLCKAMLALRATRGRCRPGGRRRGAHRRQGAGADGHPADGSAGAAGLCAPGADGTGGTAAHGGAADRDAGRRAARRVVRDLLLPPAPAGQVRAGRGGRRRDRAGEAVAGDHDVDRLGRARGRHARDGRGGGLAEHGPRRTVLRAADTLAGGQPGRAGRVAAGGHARRPDPVRHAGRARGGERPGARGARRVLRAHPPARAAARGRPPGQLAEHRIPERLQEALMVPALLRGRVFRRYWSASTISMFGDQVSGVALPLAAVLALHAGAAQMGYLTALEWLPSLLFGLPAGAWVDRRGRRRRTMIAAGLGRAVRQRPGVLRAARADAGAAVRGHVRRGDTEHLVHRVGRDAIRLDRGARTVHGRAVADLRQPGAVVRRRPEPRRGAGPAAVSPVRGGRGRAVVRRLGVLPGPDPPGRAAGQRRRRNGDRGRSVHRAFGAGPRVADRGGHTQLLLRHVRRAVPAVRGAGAAHPAWPGRRA